MSWPMISHPIKTLAVASNIGIFIAFGLIGSWFALLTILLSLNIATVSPLIVLVAIAVQTFLNTGLFITAHDAIHGSISPQHPSLNNGVGRCCAIAYAGLSYRTLTHNHLRHHQSPGSVTDPDFHDLKPGTTPILSFCLWYQNFMCQYLSRRQLMRIAIAILVGLSLGISPINGMLLWGLPLFLSSLQLFYFGTYQPHRHSIPQSVGATFIHPSHPSPWFLSLLTCYHFSYHREHHQHPQIPWWGLPAQYQANLKD